MKKEKQEKVLAIISTGRYIEQGGDIYSVKSSGIKKLSPLTHKSGYKQIHIFNGRRGSEGINAIVYVHQLVYMMHFGGYDECMNIDHIDRDPTNNDISNLRLVSIRENHLNRSNPVRSESVKTIRSEEINSIRDLMSLGLSQSAIAKELNLKRLSVRYIMKKIENNEPLKYDK